MMSRGPLVKKIGTELVALHFALEFPFNFNRYVGRNLAIGTVKPPPYATLPFVAFSNQAPQSCLTAGYINCFFKRLA